MRAILLLLVLSACVANGPIYSEPKKPSIIVYRPETTIPKAGVFYIEANGVPVCNLLPLSYFVLNEDKVTLSSSKFMMLGTSRITVTRPSYVRIELSPIKQFGVATGGLVGDIATGEGGPFTFTVVEPDIARKELAGLHRDCV